MNLSELKKGQAGRVLKIEAVPTLRKRLIDMGVLAGEVIRVEGVAPFGDPMEVLVRNYRLSLRKHEIEGILVEEVQ
ncbi:FeoA family protein [Chlorobium limicola DSM 245]|uniref:FeoA family protein n=1 Tax=Chlorobium limicola (strain DSM 245 / NBRC 103803 / 6330) TaxID=290315 RepID=B3EHQ4_CHLL2|nr:ferrous iron transport protein A [Chlorobium limicola]ACD89834.1 FeoA family protein [Chlorobium limicola DSM 245]